MLRWVLASAALLSIVLATLAGAVLFVALGRRIEEEAAIEMW